MTMLITVYGIDSEKKNKLRIKIKLRENVFFMEGGRGVRNNVTEPLKCIRPGKYSRM